MFSKIDGRIKAVGGLLLHYFPMHWMPMLVAFVTAYEEHLRGYESLLGLLPAVLNIAVFVHFQRKKKPSARNLLHLLIYALPLTIPGLLPIVAVVKLGAGLLPTVEVVLTSVSQFYLCTCILPLVQLVRITALWIVRLHRAQPAQTEQPPFTPRQKTAVKVVAVAAAVVLAAGCAYLAGDGRRLHNVVACEYRAQAVETNDGREPFLQMQEEGVPVSQEDAQTIAALLRSETYVIWKDIARYYDQPRQFLIFRTADGRKETVVVPGDGQGYVCLAYTGVQCRLSPQDSQTLYDVLQKYAHDGAAAGE